MNENYYQISAGDKLGATLSVILDCPVTLRRHSGTEYTFNCHHGLIFTLHTDSSKLHLNDWAQIIKRHSAEQ
jgi:hypothetical protein